LPAHKVEVLDTTGAGDTFNAAFLFSLIKGYDLEHSVRFANGAAALVIQSMGTRTHLPSVFATEDFIKNNQVTLVGEKE
jgi:sugar/nucleoside kinase (ribokinase family)